METLTTTETLTDLTRKGTCIAFFAAYQDLEVENMIQLATPQATVHFQPLGEDGKGSLHEFGKAVWGLLIDCFPDLDNTVDMMEANGDEVSCKVVIFGTQEKEFMGTPSKGLKFGSDHVFVFKFDEDDNITHLDINWNHQGFVAQLTGA